MDSVTGGATNDSAESILRKHLPAALTGRAWDAFLAALAVGDQFNWDNARSIFDQLFKSTASGLYLDRKASDDGLIRPPDIGMPDDLFRKLAIKTSAAKLTPAVMLEILEVFYGADSVRAGVTTELSQPFLLSDGDDLELLLDERDAVQVFFRSEWFNDIGAATAAELATSITRVLRLSRSKGFAINYTDSVTGLEKVRIYSGSLGLGSSVRVTGGRAQLGLKFPTALTTYSAAVTSGDAYTWVVTSPEPGVNRVSLTNGGGTSKVDLTAVRSGDYVVFEAENSDIEASIYEILDVGISYSAGSLIQYFDIEDSEDDHSFLQLDDAEISFFRPDKKTIHQATGRTVVVASTRPKVLDIRVPATTQAVGRTVLTGAYPHDNEALVISTVQRLQDVSTVTTTGSHGLAVGDQLILEDLWAGTGAPSVTAGADGSGSTGGLPSLFPMFFGGGAYVPGSDATSDASLATIWSQIRAEDGNGRYDHTVNALDGSTILVAGGRYLSSGAPSVTPGCLVFSLISTATLGSGAKQYTYNWIDAGDLIGNRCEHAASMLLNGTLLASGGFDGFSYYQSTEVFTAATMVWAAGPDMITARVNHQQVTLQDGNALIIGGSSDSTTVLNTVDLYDTATNTMSAAASMVSVRVDHRAVVLEDGRVLVIGGQGNVSGPELHSCEIYDPDTDTWSRTGSLAYARIGHTATVLGDGRVLVTGGTGHVSGEAPAALSHAEIWNPTTGSWHPAGRMSRARSGHSAVYLAAKNKVLVAGGAGGVLAGEYFDPTNGRWRLTPSGPTAVSGNEQMAVLDDDLALFVGGQNMDETPTQGWLYQPAEDVYGQGGLNGVFAVTAVPSTTTLQYETPDYSGLSVNQNDKLSVKHMGALDAGDIPGPFVFDPLEGAAVTAIETEATMSLFEGSQYKTLTVADASDFPDEPGWLIIGFGRDTSVAPIRYLGRQSATSLILDYSFRFPSTNLAAGFNVRSATRASNVTTLTLNLKTGEANNIVAGQVIYFRSTSASFTAGYKTVSSVTTSTVVFADAGSNTTVASPGSVVTEGPKVTYLQSKGLFMPDAPEEVGSAYITASPAGRVAALKALNESIASGFESNIEVVYPGDIGLGGAGLGVEGQVLSDKVAVWGGDNLDEELAAARGEE